MTMPDGAQKGPESFPTFWAMGVMLVVDEFWKERVFPISEV
jgi:hypothetical protein